MTTPVRALAVAAGCAGFSFLLSGMFVPAGRARIAGTVVGALPMIPAVLFRIARRGERVRKEQAGYLFQILLSRLSVGEPLELAFGSACVEAKRVWGAHSPLASGLQRLVSDLGSRAPLSQAITRFSARFSCREAEPVLAALAMVRSVGTGVTELLRTGQGMVAESIAVEDAVAAESAQRSTEACVVAAMPPVVALLLGRLAPGYLDPLLLSAFGAWVMAGLYLLSVLSISLVLRVVSGPRPIRTSPDRTVRTSPDRLVRTSPDRLVRTSLDRLVRNKEDGVRRPPALARWLAARLPTGYRVRLERLLSFAGSSDADRVARHMEKKMTMCIAGAALGAFPAAAGGSVWWIPLLALLLPLLQDRDLKRRVDRVRDQILEGFPVFLGLLSAVLHAGIPLSNALDVCLSGIPHPTSPFGRALTNIRAEVQAGRSASHGFDRMASQTDIPEVQASLSLIAQFERTGGHELLSLLRLQVPVCRSLNRNAARKRAEQHTVYLLIPMFLSLLVILAVAGLPALLAFRP
ncbi:MAG: hypothetical protein GX153_06725 [Clostridiaceae bacterium]|nr:hypothetical protein [Clostridiaceae bacterium]